MKKIIACILCTGLMVTQCFGGASTQISAKASAVFDELTGQFLFEKNADEILPMASTTKIMTALIALETLDLDREYTVPAHWTGAEGSSMYLKAGEKLTARDLLCGLLLTSGNDAAQALACIICGNEENFVMKMNERARELGLENTHFESASGLDGEKHYTTARELAIIASNAMKNANFRQIVAMKYYSGAGRTMRNHNKLLHTLDGTVGIKTGFTKKSGRCLVSAVERKGRMMIAVTLNAPNDWNDHEVLYARAFQNCSLRQIIEKGKYLECDVVGGIGRKAQIYINKECKLNLTDEEFSRISVIHNAPKFAYAPIIAGEKYGEICVQLNGKTVFSTEMYFKNDVNQREVKQNGFTEFLDKIKALF